ncbi:MAG: Cof-type HAD-IIB family hydrolase [Treponema sp.]|jgi:Cof subfamily protein (haloacid dehalogenase superfamily)|nr:Cof-type HAD-IIB family hydrolase [Treponema sp.]
MQHSNQRIDPGHIKALALDLDGTLLRPEGSLGERTVKTLKACVDHGMKAIICTGRSVEAAERYRQTLGITGPMVYFNGAEVVDMPGRSVLNAALLDTEVADYCTDLARGIGLYYQAYVPGTRGGSESILLTENYTQEADMYYKHTGVKPVIGNLKEALAAPGLKGCIKSMFISDPSTHEGIRSRLHARFGARISIVRSSPVFLEILDAQVSKGRGLTQAMEYQGLKQSQVIAFGDEENDLAMFKAAAFSAAPANAKEQVRQAADLVIGSNAEEGVAAFLEELFGLG